MRFKTILLSILWLAVVFGAVALAVARRDEYGIVAYIIIGMGAAMLVLFVVGYLPRRLQQKSAAEFVGKIFTGLLILCAVLILTVSLIKGYKNLGIIGNGFLLLFLITFIRIFINYVKDFNKQGLSSRDEVETSKEDN